MTDPKDWLMGLIEEYYWAMVSEYVVGEAEHTIARRQFCEVEDEIARLRRIEEAAREVTDAWDFASMASWLPDRQQRWRQSLIALRAALEDR